MYVLHSMYPTVQNKPSSALGVKMHSANQATAFPATV